MKKYALLALSLATIVGLVGLSSCSKDDPAPPITASFSKTTATATEADGSVSVDVVLDRATSEDLVVEYTLSGTATEGTDYNIDDSGEVEIKKGQSKGTINIDITDDKAFEGNETLKLTIDKVSNASVLIGDDDEYTLTIQENDAQATINFPVTAITTVEDAGLLEIQVKLDRVAGEDITVQYTLSGSAVDSLSAWDDQAPSDYFIDGVSGEVEIESGHSTGTIKVRLYTDLTIEDSNPNTAALDPETIIITLTGGTGGILVGPDNDLTITLKQQDGRLILLDWAYTTVDMDMFLWFGQDASSIEVVQPFSSYVESNEGPEGIFIPNSLPTIFFGSANAGFGLSHVYYSGDKDDMNFTVDYIDIVNSAFEGAGSRNHFEAKYTLANINKWDDEATGTWPPLLNQDFEMEDGQYKLETGISVPGVEVPTGRVSSPKSFSKFVNRSTGTIRKKQVFY